MNKKINTTHILFMIIGILLLALQMKQVVLYADDFSLGIVSNKGIKECIKFFIYNYNNWGGAITCLIASIFLMFRIGIWKIFIIAIISIMLELSIKLIDVEIKNKKILTIIIWECFFALNIWTSREVIYWLDGSLAYILTTFQLILYLYMMYKKIHLNKSNPYNDYLLIAVAFFAGYSSLQAGAMAILIPIILIIFEKIVNKKNILKYEKTFYFAMLMCIIGFLILYLSPGNEMRMIKSFPEFAKYNIFEKILYRAESVFGLMFDFKRYQYTGIPMFLLLAISMINECFYNKYKNTKYLKYLSIPVYAYIFLNLVDIFNISNINLSKYIFEYKNIFRIKNYNISIFIPYFIGSIIIIINLLQSYLLSKKEKNPLLFLLLFLAYSVQLIMLLSPYSPLRTTIYTIWILWIIILYIVNENIKHNNQTISFSILTTSCIYNINLGFSLMIILFLLKFYQKKEYILIIIMLGTISIYNYIDITTNYKKNKEIYMENINRIENYKENGQESELYLLVPEKEQYGFTPMVGYEWVEKDIKEYFKLPEKLSLKIEKKEE